MNSKIVKVHVSLIVSAIKCILAWSFLFNGNK